MAELLCQRDKHINDEDKALYNKLGNTFNSLSFQLRNQITESIADYLIKKVGKDKVED